MMGLSLQCMNCLDIIVSVSRHDYKSCRCFKAWSQVLSSIPENLQYANKKRTKYSAFFSTLMALQRGIFVDGGDDYSRLGGNLLDISYTEDLKDDLRAAKKRPTKTEAKRIKAVKDLRSKSRRS